MWLSKTQSRTSKYTRSLSYTFRESQCVRKLDSKNISQLIAYNSGEGATQVNYILVRRSGSKLRKDIKVIRNEERIPQHKLSVAVFKALVPAEIPCFIVPKQKLWRLREL